MIRGVLFDAYGTLFDIYSISVVADSIWPGRGAELAALWREKQIEYTRLRTLCGQYSDFWNVTQDALEYSCESLRLALSDSNRATLMGAYAELNSYLENSEALARMHEAGLLLGILSNGTPAMLKTALNASGLTAYFSHVISVDQVRKYKTAPEAYRLGSEILGAPARDILFVSSNGWDVCGATWFGYQTFWLNRAGRPAERLGVSPHLVGKSMLEVASFAISHASSE
jgi:2-haloacid dehalogenase